MLNGIGFVAASLCLQAGAANTLTVDELVSRHIEARGGAAKLKAIQSLRLTGKAVMGFGDRGFESSWAQLQKRPAMIRSEITRQGLTAVDAFDGKDGWNMEPFRGRREPQRLSADESKAMAQAADLDGPLVGWREKGHKVEYLGTEDI